MPSNIDLIENIKIEAEAKGVDVPETGGKNNAQLAEILKTLKVSAPAPDTAEAEAAAKAEAEAEAEAEAAAEAAAKAEKPPYYICDGKSLTCKAGKNGMLSEGDEIKAEWLPDGIERIKELIKIGVVAKG